MVKQTGTLAHLCTLNVATKLYSMQKMVMMDTYARERERERERDFACPVKQFAAMILTHVNKNYSPNKM
jgi:hypothetical protein